jgi:hypothetical protein
MMILHVIDVVMKDTIQQIVMRRSMLMEAGLVNFLNTHPSHTSHTPLRSMLSAQFLTKLKNGIKTLAFAFYLV